MIETTNMTNTGALMMSRAAAQAAGWAANLKSGQQEQQQQQGANVEYFRAYYCALVTKGAERIERNRHLEAIKTGRRKARRERWLQSIKSLANVLSGAEAVN